MKIKKDWFGMFSSTREYARSIYVASIYRFSSIFLFIISLLPVFSVS